MADRITIGIVLKATADKAESVLRSFGGAAQKAFKIVIGAAAAVGAAFAGMIAHTVKLSDALMNASDRSGASVEFLSQMGFHAKQSGSSLATVEKALVTVSKKAIDGGKAFGKWGVDLKNSDGTLKSSQQLFITAADRIGKLKSSTAQAAAAQDLFGKAGKELLPILRGGAQGILDMQKAADDAGVTIDSLTVRLGDAFGDELAKSQDQTSALFAQISQFFLPILTVLIQRFNETSGAVRKWIAANKQLIESKITAFLIWIADNALPAIAVGVDLVAKVWLGWKLLFQTLEFAASKFVQVVLEGFAAAASKAGDLADFLGADGLAKDLRQLSTEQTAAAKEFESAADVASLEMAKTAAEIRNTETAIGNFGARASGALRQAAHDAQIFKEQMAALGPTGTGAVAEGGLPGGAGGKKKAGHDPFSRIESDAIKKSQAKELSKERLMALKAEQKAADELKQKYIDLGTTMANALGTAFVAVIDGSQSAGDALKGLLRTGLDMLMQLAIQEITMAAASGAAGAGASATNSGIPFPWNIAAAISAMATVFGIIIAMKGKLHMGGVVPGPIGTERMMVLQGGEEVESTTDRRGRKARGGGSGNGDTTIIVENIESNSLNVPSQAGWERSLQDGLVRTVDRMTARGAGFGQRSRRPLRRT